MNFNNKKSLTGFTLIELLVVIAIIWVMALAVTRIDFNRISDSQKLDLFTNEVVSKLETIRNNALIGKWVGINVETPDLWEIDINDNEMVSKYDGVISDDYSISFIPWYTITPIECSPLDESTVETVSWVATISITGRDLEISSGCSDTNKILTLTPSYKSFQKVIRINTVSWLIEVD